VFLLAFLTEEEFDFCSFCLTCFVILVAVAMSLGHVQRVFIGSCLFDVMFVVGE
jgi:hypothetical protein